jgi:hypothetical protein
MNARKRNGDLLVDGLTLKSIMDKQLSIIGYGVLDFLYYEMNRQGFVFENGRTYSFEQLESFFNAIFGEEAAALMLDRIRKGLVDHKTRPEKD